MNGHHDIGVGVAGTTVGDGVGVGDGTTVGVGVGVGDGATVGDGVGVADGTAVGDGVGAGSAGCAQPAIHAAIIGSSIVTTALPNGGITTGHPLESTA